MWTGLWRRLHALLLRRRMVAAPAVAPAVGSAERCCGCCGGGPAGAAGGKCSRRSSRCGGCPVGGAVAAPAAVAVAEVPAVETAAMPRRVAARCLAVRRRTAGWSARRNAALFPEREALTMAASPTGRRRRGRSCTLRRARRSRPESPRLVSAERLRRSNRRTGLNHGCRALDGNRRQTRRRWSNGRAFPDPRTTRRAAGRRPTQPSRPICTAPDTPCVEAKTRGRTR